MALGVGVCWFAVGGVGGIIGGILAPLGDRIYYKPQFEKEIAVAEDAGVDPLHILAGSAVQTAKAWDLYSVGTKLGSKGHTEEALAAYDECASKFGDIDVANDAKISADELRKRIK